MLAIHRVNALDDCLARQLLGHFSRGTDCLGDQSDLGSRLITQCLALVASQVAGLGSIRPLGGQPSIILCLRAPAGGMSEGSWPRGQVLSSAAVRERGWVRLATDRAVRRRAVLMRADLTFTSIGPSLPILCVS